MDPAGFIESGHGLGERPSMRPGPRRQWLDLQDAAHSRNSLRKHAAGILQVTRREDGIDVRNQDGRIISPTTSVVGDPGDDGIVIDEYPIELDPFFSIEDQSHGDHGLPGKSDIGQCSRWHESFGLRLRHAQSENVGSRITENDP